MGELQANFLQYSVYIHCEHDQTDLSGDPAPILIWHLRVLDVVVDEREDIRTLSSKLAGIRNKAITDAGDLLIVLNLVSCGQRAIE